MQKKNSTKNKTQKQKLPCGWVMNFRLIFLPSVSSKKIILELLGLNVTETERLKNHKLNVKCA